MGHATHQRGKRRDRPHNYEVRHHYCKKEKREKRKENHRQDVEKLEEGAEVILIHRTQKCSIYVINELYLFLIGHF